MDRLPTPVFLGFPYGSTGKEPACNVGGLGSIPGLGKPSVKGRSYPLQNSRLEKFHVLYSPWGCKELDTTEQLLLFSFTKSYLHSLHLGSLLAHWVFALRGYITKELFLWAADSTLKIVLGIPPHARITLAHLLEFYRLIPTLPHPLKQMEGFSSCSYRPCVSLL